MVLKSSGYPDRFVALIGALHDGMVDQVSHQNNISEEFPITNRLKQGCVLAPTLFAMYLAAMLQEIPEMDNTGIEIKYRFDGGLFNLSRLRSQKLSKATRITELQMLICR